MSEEKTKKITLTINGKKVEATPEQTVLEAARSAGFNIPTLCDHEDLEPFGACRLCIVQIEGQRGLPPSCLMKVADGMVVHTDTPEIRSVRKVVAELLLADHPEDCLYCEKNLSCELQRIAQELGIREKRLRKLKRDTIKDESNPFFVRDMSKCILCGRCIRTCEQITGIHAIDFVNRGYNTLVAPYNLSDITQSRCQSCGECVVRCPTGALHAREEKIPSKEVSVICPYCGVGCGILLGVREGRIVSVRGNRDSIVNHGRLCVKGRFGVYDFVQHPDRLKTPLIRADSGEFREATWDEALNLVAKKLGENKGKFAALSSAKTSNEDNYVFQKFVRSVMKTNNIDHCARLCHSSTVTGLAAAFGSGAMTNSIEEIKGADCILLTGTNTTENHPVISLTIKEAVTRGAKLIIVDPRRIDLVEMADVFLQCVPGTDVAWINGMMNVIIEENLTADQYIKERTEGFDALKEVVKKYTPEYVEKITGIPAEDLRLAARLFGQAEKGSIVYCMGITQHITGTDNVKSLANLAMLTGNVGFESTGVNPLRGQNNVQGACDMGALPNVYPGYQPVNAPDIRAKFEKAWGVDGLDGRPGLTITEMLNAARKGEIKAMYIMGENPMLSDPDLKHVEESLDALDFLVVQDIFLTETAKKAHVVLPATSFAEKEGTFTNTERRVQLSNKVIDPPSSARGDWEIIVALATRMGYEMKYASASEIMKEIASVTPQYGGITYERIRETGLLWPCPTPDHPGTKFLHKDKFSRGKGLFSAIEFISPDELPDKEYPLILTTGRVLYQYHTGTMTRKSRGLETLAPEPLLEINPEDAKKLNLESEDIVTVSSRRGSVTAKAKVTDRVGKGVLFLPFHFAEAAANRLTNPVTDPVSKIPEFKVCAVKVEKAKVVMTAKEEKQKKKTTVGAR